MKLVNLIIILCFLSTLVLGQQISRSILTTAGTFSKNEKGISLSWTMGDIFCKTIQKEYHLTEGFQQGILSGTFIDSIENTDSYRLDNSTTSNQKEIVVKVLAYPNPTTDHLSLRFETTVPQLVIVNIINEFGSRILQQKIYVEDGKEVELEQIENIITGTYFMELVKDGKTIVTKSFIKLKL